MKAGIRVFAVFLALCVCAGSVSAAGVFAQNGSLNATGSLYVGPSGSTLFVNSTSGFVGIGTANSTRPLHIAAIQDANIRLQDTSGASPAAYIEFYNDTSRWGYVGLGGHDDRMVIGTTTEKNLTFYTNDSAKMTLAASGNLGVGTANPQAKVHTYSSTGSGTHYVLLEGNGTIHATVGLQFKTELGAKGAALSSFHGDLEFDVGNWSPMTRAMTILTTGNVGIGTTSPSAALHVVPTTNLTGGSGGDLVYDIRVDGISYRVHKFTTVGTSTFTPPAEVTSVEYLVVGGGGGGGSSSGTGGSGGGGAGGVATGTYAVSGSVTVTVGAGGAKGGSPATNGTSGQNSSLGTIIAFGGGGGGTQSSPGKPGGSGGGGGAYTSTGGNATTGQGYNGGSHPSGLPENSCYWAAGGGGAGGLGVTINSSSPNGGNGGIGIVSSINGTSMYYAGGGGAGPSGVGGLGGGGSVDWTGYPGVNGTGGGGGGAYTSSYGADGGSGVVIIRYPISATLRADGTSFFNGSVGVGTTSPGAKLEVDGPTKSKDAVAFMVYSGGFGKRLVVKWSGEPTRKYKFWVDDTVGLDTAWYVYYRDGTYKQSGWASASGGSLFGVGANENTALQVGNDFFTLYFNRDRNVLTQYGCANCTPILSVAYNDVIPLVEGDFIKGINVLVHGPGNSIFTSSSGNVGINTSSPSYTLTVAGTAWVTSGAWSGSDARWKQNVTSLLPSTSLDKVLALRPVSYEWKTAEYPNMGFTNGTQLGFIAQDVEKIIPEIVTTDNRGYKGISYEKITPVITSAMQQQQNEIEVLRVDKARQQARIDSLETDNRMLKSELCAKDRTYSWCD